MVVFKEIDSKILPLAVQKYLWDQISTVFQLKTQHASQETLATTGTVCQRLEKMLVHDKVKELQKFFSPELFSEIKSIPRWTFIKGSLSYVIHCVAMILEKRYVLGMTDQLKPFVIKLLYTLHWIVTEAYKECSKPKDEGLDLTDIELFLHMCIPFLSNLMMK
ncbi:protein unc-80 homolog [Clytia hemisphaerica]|uniref:Cation channel complex component UNC80 N-terminal domain-containing protein n=1 Tax=Clytia hemisphaerica TaxID=252671 RepID=A0A7M5WIJ4_9CNID